MTSRRTSTASPPAYKPELLPQNRRVVLALAGAYLPRPYVHFRTALDKLLPYLHGFDDTLHFVFKKRAITRATCARRCRIRR